MNPLLATTLDHLRALVAFDTRNPPRAIGTGGIFDYLRAHLPGFGCTVTDHGAGAVSLFAVRGRPKVLFNVHLDTVPDSPHWTASPFDLRVTDSHAIGLGACDIKGAAAALLTAAAQTDDDAAFLFTTDEEANDARCIAAFLKSFPSPAGGRWREAPDEGNALPSAAPIQSIEAVSSSALRAPSPGGRRDDSPFSAVVVAEPTRGEAVLAHRGISSVLMNFKGRAGHASGGNAATDSALHQAIRWGQHALDFVEAQAHQRFGGLTGLRFNIGRIDGGIKANMIAPAAEVRFGFRPLPSMDIDALLATFRDACGAQPAEFQETFRGPSLPAGDIAQAEARRLKARDFADEVGLPIGNAVDFWTEASLFSQAGYSAIVCGP
ncbi:MAG: M20/M25/M40 family metallo-hydrolase, partial [Proteobacteria bacterium]|nr:M20/M25/M40 family metallo-hydrolase [Pseudomonadota bacterium]